MKKILLIALCALMLAACNKNVSVNGSTRTFTTLGLVDTFTLTDNGVTFTDSAGLLQLSCDIQRISTGSVFSFSNNAATFFPYEIDISGITNTALNSVGVYKIAPADSFVSGEFFFEEITDSNQTEYTIDSVLFNITYAGGDTVKGDYTIWAENGSYTKKVNGIIRCYNAQRN